MSQPHTVAEPQLAPDPGSPSYYDITPEPDTPGILWYANHRRSLVIHSHSGIYITSQSKFHKICVELNNGKMRSIGVAKSAGAYKPIMSVRTGVVHGLVGR
jgi:hypothetical protein